MPAFGARSTLALNTAHTDLQRLFHEVIKHFDCTVLEGHRDRESQDAVFMAGNSKVEWPNSKHNSLPSLAVDVVPYPIDWNDKARFYYFAGFVKGIASQLGIDIRWGGDWNSDTNLHNQRFYDLPHYELAWTYPNSSEDFF